MTGLLYDPQLLRQHDLAQHAENAARLSRLDPFVGFRATAARPATDEELLAVHTLEHLQRVASKVSAGGGMLDPDTYCGPQSEIVARSGAGGLVDLCLGVQRGENTNGLALVRPPGHHATADRAMGFCLYNSVAVAADALRENGARRVAIVDFDVHHGNGTQDIFYRREDVLYISSHQYPHYPGTGAVSETGDGPGLGTTINHPLPEGTGDEGFMAAYDEHLLPALVAFRPDFILVSAGYDAHDADPLAGLCVTTAGYEKLVQALIVTARDACEGRIVFALEGGYDPMALAECIGVTAGALQQADK